jgi:hypothetical protein
VVLQRASAKPESSDDRDGKRAEVQDGILTRPPLIEPCPDLSPEIPDPIATPTMPRDKKKHVTEEDTIREQ